MNKILLGTAMMITLLGTSATAQRFNSPCERGPVPEWSMINEAKGEFVSWLMKIRPKMTRATAESIAYQLCDDMSLVGDGPALTRRLNRLLKQNGS